MPPLPYLCSLFLSRSLYSSSSDPLGHTKTKRGSSTVRSETWKTTKETKHTFNMTSQWETPSKVGWGAPYWHLLTRGPESLATRRSCVPWTTDHRSGGEVTLWFRLQSLSVDRYLPTEWTIRLHLSLFFFLTQKDIFTTGIRENLRLADWLHLSPSTIGLH